MITLSAYLSLFFKMRFLYSITQPWTLICWFIYGLKVKLYKIYSFFTPKRRASNRCGPFDHDTMCIIYGRLLGDTYLEKGNGRVGSLLRIEQSLEQKEFVQYVMNLLVEKGLMKPVVLDQCIRKRLSRHNVAKYEYTIKISSFVFGTLDFIHSEFYVNHKKVVPLNIIEYLSPLALALWICADGSRQKKTFHIATHSFSLNCHETLRNALLQRYGIKTSIHWLNNKQTGDKIPFLYIRTESAHTLKNLIRPYMVPSMLYKLGE